MPLRTHHLDHRKQAKHHAPEGTRARDQALSYAVKLRIASFAVAAAEGFWVYELPRHHPTLALHVETAELRHRAQEIIEAMHEFDARHLG